jgi:hypothetical protein
MKKKGTCRMWNVRAKTLIATCLFSTDCNKGALSGSCFDNTNCHFKTEGQMLELMCHAQSFLICYSCETLYQYHP